MDLNYFFTYETELPAGSGYALFSSTHLGIMLSALFVLIIFGVIYKNIVCIKNVSVCGASENHEITSRVRKVTSVSVLFLMLIRIIYLFATGHMSVYELPLHFCSVMGFLCYVNYISTGRFHALTSQVLYSLGLPAVLCAFIFPNGNMYPALSFISLQSYIFHLMVLLYIEEGLIDGSIHPEAKKAYMVPLFLLITVPIIYLINHIFNSNYFFINTPSKGSPLEGILLVFGSGLYLLGLGLLVLLVMGLMYLFSFLMSVLLLKISV